MGQRRDGDPVDGLRHGVPSLRPRPRWSPLGGRVAHLARARRWPTNLGLMVLGAAVIRIALPLAAVEAGALGYRPWVGRPWCGRRREEPARRGRCGDRARSRDLPAAVLSMACRCSGGSTASTTRTSFRHVHGHPLPSAREPAVRRLQARPRRGLGASAVAVVFEVLFNAAPCSTMRTFVYPSQWIACCAGSS